MSPRYARPLVTSANVLAVIKADGYGHGAELIAPVLVDAGVTWLGVGDVDEGARVRRALGKREAHVLVMCGIEPGDADRIVEHRLTPVVWTPAHVQALEAAAERAGRRVAVHLEIDSGMARQGAAPGDGAGACCGGAAPLQVAAPGGRLQPPQLVRGAQRRADRNAAGDDCSSAFDLLKIAGRRGP